MFNHDYIGNRGSRSMRSNTDDLRQRHALRYDDDAIEDRALEIQAIIAQEHQVSRRVVSLSVIRSYIEVRPHVDTYAAAYAIGDSAIQSGQ